MVKAIQLMGYVICVSNAILFAQTSKPTSQPAEDKPQVVVIRIYDPIEDTHQVKLIKSAIHDCDKSKTVKAIVVKIDSFGGFPELISQVVNDIKLAHKPIISYIDNARYGGVFGPACAVAFACQKVYINPQAKIGTTPASSPLEIRECKEWPVSNIHEKTNQLWMNAKEPIDQESLESFLNVREGVKLPENLFTKTATSPKGIQAKEAIDRNWCDKITDNPLPIVNSMTGFACLEINKDVKSTLSQKIKRIEEDQEDIKILNTKMDIKEYLRDYYYFSHGRYVLYHDQLWYDNLYSDHYEYSKHIKRVGRDRAMIINLSRTTKDLLLIVKENPNLARLYNLDIQKLETQTEDYKNQITILNEVIQHLKRGETKVASLRRQKERENDVPNASKTGRNRREY